MAVRGVRGAVVWPESVCPFAVSVIDFGAGVTNPVSGVPVLAVESESANVTG